MKSKIFSIILFFFSSLIFSQAKDNWINFDWQGETIFGKYYPKVAISIPIKIENLPYKFCGQFDMGASTTMIYENSFKQFAEKHPEVLNKLDTAISPFYLNGRKSNFIKNLNFKLDKTTFSKNVAYIPNFGEEIPTDSINSASQKLIGTIGTDIFQGKIVVIDFPNNRLKTFEKLPKKYQKANFVLANIRKGRIKIPLMIGNKTEYVMFDTGNCMGNLLLDKETINKFTNYDEEPQEFLNGNSWGQSIVLYNKNLKQSVYLNNLKLDISKAQFSDQDVDVQFNKEEKIIGLIGPVLFADKIIIIDYKNNKFGVL